MAPKFYVEESVARKTVTDLRSAGFKVAYAIDLSHYGWDDPDHLVYAVENGYVVGYCRQERFPFASPVVDTPCGETLHQYFSFGHYNRENTTEAHKLGNIHQAFDLQRRDS